MEKEFQHLGEGAVQDRGVQELNKERDCATEQSLAGTRVIGYSGAYGHLVEGRGREAEYS